MSTDFYNKYLKYKNKYISLYNLIGGSHSKIDLVLKNQDKLYSVYNDQEHLFNQTIEKNISNINKLVCLDFHGVADLFDVNEKIPNNIPKCIISYIGGNPETVRNTFNFIKHKVDANEVLFGVIVYKKHNQPICGTKGWIIKKILDTNPNLSIHFMDDSRKNISCVNNLNDNRIRTYYINKKHQPKNQLINILTKL